MKEMSTSMEMCIKDNIIIIFFIKVSEILSNKKPSLKLLSILCC